MAFVLFDICPHTLGVIQGTRPCIGVLSNLIELGIPRLDAMRVLAEVRNIDLRIIPLGVLPGEFPGVHGIQRLGYLLANPRLDGLICFTENLVNMAGEAEVCRLLKGWQDRPMISLGRRIFDEPCVSIDRFTGLDALLDHLFADHGYRHPLFVCAPETGEIAQRRNERFTLACQRHAIPQEAILRHYGQWSTTSGREAFEAVWQRGGQRPDVVVAANDHMALGFRHAMLEAGLLVPDDLALTGYDAIRLSPIVDCPVTSVSLPVREQGTQALQMLLDRLEGKTPADLVLPSRLELRESCGCHTCHFQSPYPKLNQRIQALENPAATHWQYKGLLEIELVDSIHELQHQAHVENLTANWIRSVFETRRIQGQAEQLKNLTDSLGIGHFFLTVFPDTTAGLPAESRLMLAVRDWEALDIPETGISFSTNELLPREYDPPGHSTLFCIPLGNGKVQFGTLLMEFRPQLESSNSHEHRLNKLRERLSTAYLWIRDSQRLEALNQDLETARARVEALSLSDDLTGLYNRRGFFSLASHQIQYYRRSRQAFWIFYIDLDKLKQINDNFGHDAGDTALREFARILPGCCRDSDIVARLGGDEFVIMAADTSTRGMQNIRRRLEKALAGFNQGREDSWILGVSMGGHFSPPGDKTSLEDMMKKADSALYSEKKRKHSP